MTSLVKQQLLIDKQIPSISLFTQIDVNGTTSPVPLSCKKFEKNISSINCAARF